MANLDERSLKDGDNSVKVFFELLAVGHSIDSDRSRFANGLHTQKGQ